MFCASTACSCAQDQSPQEGSSEGSFCARYSVLGLLAAMMEPHTPSHASSCTTETQTRSELRAGWTLKPGVLGPGGSGLKTLRAKPSLQICPGLPFPFSKPKMPKPYSPTSTLLEKAPTSEGVESAFEGLIIPVHGRLLYESAVGRRCRDCSPRSVVGLGF